MFKKEIMKAAKYVLQVVDRSESAVEIHIEEYE
jgi:hypothetical protein